MEMNSSGFYKVGTKERVLKRLYARNEFTNANTNFITVADVPSTTLTLRAASAAISGSEQNFVHCNCKRNCTDKKCKCRANNILCNSKCHSNSSCKNK